MTPETTRGPDFLQEHQVGANRAPPFGSGSHLGRDSSAITLLFALMDKWPTSHFCGAVLLSLLSASGASADLWGDVMCLGAQKAIADAKQSGEILIFGFDGQKAAVEQIMKGSNFVATGVNSADAIAKAGFKTMMDLLAGKKLAQKDSMPPVQVVTPENAKQIYRSDALF
jgi:hypothetical protein